MIVVVWPRLTLYTREHLRLAFMTHTSLNPCYTKEMLSWYKTAIVKVYFIFTNDGKTLEDNCDVMSHHSAYQPHILEIQAEEFQIRRPFTIVKGVMCQVCITLFICIIINRGSIVLNAFEVVFFRWFFLTQSRLFFGSRVSGPKRDKNRLQSAS